MHIKGKNTSTLRKKNMEEQHNYMEAFRRVPLKGDYCYLIIYCNSIIG